MVHRHWPCEVRAGESKGELRVDENRDRGLRHPAVLELLGLLVREVSNLRYETTPTCNPSRLAAGIASVRNVF